MNTKSIAQLLSLTALMVSASTYGQTQVPNSFTPGTPARAAEVNDNFTAVEAAVDDNAADIAANTGDIAANVVAIQGNTTSIIALASGSGVAVYSQGTEVGRFLSGSPDTSGDIFVLSSNGFVFRVSTQGVPASQYLGQTVIYFSEADCGGDAFIRFDGVERWAGPVGLVVGTSGASPSPAYYTARGSNYILSAPFQSNDNGTCNNGAGTLTLFPVFPNDEAITGVSNIAPNGPLVLGVP